MGSLFSWITFKRMFAAAALAGVISGSLLTGIQQIQIYPIIQQAEIFEQAASTKTTDSHVHAHDQSQDNASHEAHTEDWQPQNGYERTFFSAVANISLAVGFGLIIVAVFTLTEGLSNQVNHHASDWKVGLLWGLAGYVVFFVAPSLSLPPELPGTESAPLHNRQFQWLLTVSMTAIGLLLSVLAKKSVYKILGLILLLLPHLIGLPQLQQHVSLAMTDLSNFFIQATLIANALFWLCLGALTIQFYKIFSKTN